MGSRRVSLFFEIIYFLRDFLLKKIKSPFPSLSCQKGTAPFFAKSRGGGVLLFYLVVYRSK